MRGLQRTRRSLGQDGAEPGVGPFEANPCRPGLTADPSIVRPAILWSAVMFLAADASAAATAVDPAERPEAVFTPVATAPSLPTDARYLEQLERAVSVALSPLDFPNAIAWGDELTSSLCPLANAVAGAILLPDGSPRWRAVSHNPGGTHDAAWGIHEEATERLLEEATAGDLVLWARDDLTDSGAPARTAQPGTIGIRVRTP